MREAMLERMEELMRETFEGGLPGAGTEYLDNDSGIRSTLARFTAAQASVSRDGHPSIAAHVRHMIFHLRASHEWVRGDHRKRDWPGSFRPFEVSEAEWRGLAEEFERERREFVRAMRSLDDRAFVGASGGMGVIAHLAYHLGAIRQLMHQV
jgi:hypothetical protein